MPRPVDWTAVVTALFMLGHFVRRGKMIEIAGRPRSLRAHLRRVVHLHPVEQEDGDVGDIEQGVTEKTCDQRELNGSESTNVFSQTSLSDFSPQIMAQ